MFDFDPTTAQAELMQGAGLNVFERPDEAAKFVRDTFLPPELRTATLLWSLSSTAGKEGKPWLVKVHFFVWTREARTCEQMKAFATRTCDELMEAGWADRREERAVRHRH